MEQVLTDLSSAKLLEAYETQVTTLEETNALPLLMVDSKETALKKMTAKEVLAAYAKGERDFTKIDLNGVHFPKETNLSEADFSYSKLTKIKLERANLTACKMVQTNLSYARLNNSDLSQSDFTEANLAMAYLVETSAVKANFSSSTCNFAWFAKGHFTEGIFSTVDFTAGTLWGAKFHKCKMDGIILEKARCSTAEFVDCTPEVVIK